MTHEEVESEVRRLCKENGIDFIFITTKITSLSADNEAKKLKFIWRALSPIIDSIDDSDSLEAQYEKKLALKHFINESDEDEK